ncbi:hypothetical protein GUJ93_ZPchr0011g28463 [Zizania palustris]|uniref:Uncharacterized protein n=1 Tax=Zizania palustris TaxID=103762 RepID=A0A8J5WME9_ZIZPA|nr:hypothetical protein GUJ93_ZPchr0011g28463 [Zizania palustris]
MHFDRRSPPTSGAAGNPPVAASGRRLSSSDVGCSRKSSGRRLRSPPELLRRWVQQEQVESGIKQLGSVHRNDNYVKLHKDSVNKREGRNINNGNIAREEKLKK